MSNLLTLNYWFNLRAGELETKANKIFIIFLLILAIFYVVIIFLKRKRKDAYTKIYVRAASFFFTNFFLGLILWFFTYESIPFLSARFWFLIWFGSMIAWKVSIIKNIITITKSKELYKKENEYKKYLP